MTANPAAYFLPAIPLVTRLVLCLRWRKQMTVQLPEEAQERDLQRTFIFSLAGFSFTAVAGLAVLDGAVRVSLQLPTWNVLASFVSLVSALNVQSYKSSRWQNQLATALLEVGTLSLMLALVALLFSASFGCAYQWMATVVTLGSWLADHLIRMFIDNTYLAALTRRNP
ncbi:hypothetical protein [Caballeronia mineralivorans]|jgi:hypothetical protein|uniref:hypothetical protein n=1 Tax=Caballeronia mineralivorans TaxID=2010198 RepID=UPI0023EF8A04|nr:hypothetical protein [Caballeronia mineralivorans]MDB5785450.1 rane protein [Caballeronia mineralivorans]